MTTSSNTTIGSAIILLLIGLVLVYSTSVCRATCSDGDETFARAEGDETFARGGQPWKDPYGEYNEVCRWDARRFCTLSDGSEGKCVLNSVCVPSMLLS